MHWGDFVREKRLEAGYGLRQFAALVGLQPSNYNHMEKGRKAPPQGKGKLDQIAEVLGIESGSDDYSTLMDLAVENKNKLPADVEEFAKSSELIPILLRTLKNRKLTKAEFKRVFEQLNQDLSRQPNA